MFNVKFSDTDILQDK